MLKTVNKTLLVALAFLLLLLYLDPLVAQWVPTLPATHTAASKSIFQTIDCGTFGTTVNCTITPHSTSDPLVVYVESGTTTAVTVGSGCGTSTIQAHTETTHAKALATIIPNTTGSCNIAVGGASAQLIGIVWECIGCNATIAVDGTPAFATGFQGAAFNGPSTTPTNNNAMVFAGANANGAVTINVTAPYTEDIAGLVDAGAFYVEGGHLLLTPAGATHVPYAVQSGGGTYDEGIIALD